MQYTVTINENAKEIKVNLNGYEGVAKCCPTDNFNITTGVELALERAKVAKAKAEDKSAKASAKAMGVMELVKALEKALPKGQVVLVGNGKELTKENKAWLRSLIGEDTCECECCDHLSDEEIDDMVSEAYDEGYEKGYDEGYDDGYDEAVAVCEESDADMVDELAERIRDVLEDVIID
jgi:flagellar biosynthesis/type III secretory pathway protein FliH